MASTNVDTKKKKLAVEYLIKYPVTPVKTIARMLVSDHPDLFADDSDEHRCIERARTLLRYYTGQTGKKNRKYAKEILTPDKRKKLSESDSVRLPQSDAKDWKPYVLPKECRHLGILSDIHIPYQDNAALELAMLYLLDRGVDSILLNGDTVDFYSISRFSKDPSKLGIREEIERAKDFLYGLRSMFGDKVKIIWKDGNHDERFMHYIMNRTPEFFGLNGFDIPSLLELEKLKIDHVSERRIIKAGKLNIIHGHEVPHAFSPVNAARGLFMKMKTNAACGHFHATSEHAEKNANNEIIGCWSIGCLSELHPQYMPINKWNHGFAEVEIDEDGGFEFHNHKIINGKIR